MTAPRPLRPLLLGMGWFREQPGGLNRYVAELFDALAERGTHATVVVVASAADAPAGPVVSAAAMHAPLPWRLAAVARAARARARTADVVDVHFPLYGAAALALGAVRRLPMVAHFQGPWADEGRLAGDGAAKAAAKRRVERFVYRRARTVVTLSAAFRRLAVERYRIPPWRVTVVPPGVDTHSFRPGSRKEARQALDLPADAWIAVSVRRLTPRMGLDTLIDAWAAVGGDALLVVAGDGPAREVLHRMAAGSAAAKRIHFAGRVPESRLADLYRAADVCVIPSVALEGFALVGLEALACGTPVVATDVGGMSEWLRPLDPSCLVAPADPEGLGSRLESARSGRLPLPSPEACRSHAERFTWGDVARRHEQLYEEAVRPPGKRLLRVVYIDHCARLSGGEVALLRLVQALPVEAHVILGEDGPLVDRLEQAGISVEVLPLAPGARDTSRWSVKPLAAFSVEGLQTAVYAARLARRLRAYRPDVVHLNSLKACLYGGVAARLAGVPAVWHLRNRLAADYLPPPAIRLAHSSARSLADAVIVNSAATNATLPPALEATIIPSPVPVTVPATASGPRNGFLVGVVGRLTPGKGQHVFLEAFARAFPTGDARAVLVGAPLFGEDAYESRLRDRCNELGLDGRVTFAGFRADVDGELAQLDALVHASIVPEPFGLAVAEGMAAGLPVVAPAAGGPVEFIEHGVSGLLYPPGDPDALADALRTVANDPALRERLGAAARERVKAFAPDIVAEQTMDVYRRVLGRRR